MIDPLWIFPIFAAWFLLVYLMLKRARKSYRELVESIKERQKTLNRPVEMQKCEKCGTWYGALNCNAECLICKQKEQASKEQFTLVCRQCGSGMLVSDNRCYVCYRPEKGIKSCR